MSRRSWVILILVIVAFVMFPVTMTGLFHSIITAVTDLIHALKGTGLH